MGQGNCVKTIDLDEVFLVEDITKVEKAAIIYSFKIHLKTNHQVVEITNATSFNETEKMRSAVVNSWFNYRG